MKTKLSKLIITLLILISFIISPLLSNRADEFEFMKEVVEKNHKNFFNTVQKKSAKKSIKGFPPTLMASVTLTTTSCSPLF